MLIYLYEDILDVWGEPAGTILTGSITAVNVGFGLPAFSIQPPLRWASDTEIPLQMEVDYESFVVHRGCGESNVACSPAGTVQVIPGREVSAPAPTWDDDTTVTVTGLVETLCNDHPEAPIPDGLRHVRFRLRSQGI